MKDKRSQPQAPMPGIQRKAFAGNQLPFGSAEKMEKKDQVSTS